MQLADTLSKLSQRGTDDGAPIVIINTLPNIVTFTDDDTRRTITWQGHGDPHGKDVSEIHYTMLRNPQFREQILRGILALGNAEELTRGLQLQRAHWDDRQLTAANTAVEIAKPNEIVGRGQACIAPKGRDLCGTYALVMDENTVPLCGEHMNLAAQYEPQKTGRLVDNKEEIIWKRISFV